jgi:transcriptional regulator with AAA-type ATPase domain
MPFRLVGQLRDRPLRLALKPGVNRLGSGSDADLVVDDPTVSRSHAELAVEGDAVHVRDLTSRNGTFVGDRKISRERVTAGDTIAFGQVRLQLESVAEADLVAGISFETDGRGPGDSGGGQFSTVRTKPIESFVLERLPLLLETLEQGADLARLAASAGAAVFETLPVLAVEVTRAGGVLFVARRDLEGVAGKILESGDEQVGLRVTFAEPDAASAFAPLLVSVVRLLRLADRGPAPVPPRAPSTPALPEPPSVVAEVQRVYAEAARVARGDVGVLITGESGTGKEVLARYLHAASRRSGGPFVALNCAALPRDLLETELFGIEKGVATGVEARPGRFELAHGGTLFLDEIGDMALETQAKILRVLQEGTVHRIGGAAPRKAEVRIVAATNRDMRALLESRQFREDLFYRIATWRVELPPLRRRRADIPNLAVHFLSREAARNGVRVRGISQGALERLVADDWPGNIRQLENEMARCVLFLGDGDLLDSNHLLGSGHPPGAASMGAGAPSVAGPVRLDAVLEQAEREAIVQALQIAGGDVEKAAERLGTARSTLYRRIKALGIAASED